MYNAHEGQSLTCIQSFLDDNGLPATLKTGYPKAKIMLETNEVISDVFPEIQTDGTWSAVVTIPELGFNDPTPVQLKWRAVDNKGNKFKTTDIILVQPAKLPDVGDIVLMHDEVDLRFIIPVSIENYYNMWISIYQNNDALVKSVDIPVAQRNKHASYTVINVLKNPIIVPQLSSYLTIIDYATFNPINQRMMFNLWVVTPQMLNCMNALESSLNKAKLENVIPQLEYTQSDLLHYMQRGLNLFNGYSPNLTDFNGTNMQGALFDSLILCASYYALGAQLLAEGMLAFDFSGQAVTLNVDRTPQLEAALGRVESQISERIPKVKQMLLRRGVTGGSGSDPVGSSAGFGHVVLTNSPTTSKNVFRAGSNAYYR